MLRLIARDGLEGGIHVFDEAFAVGDHHRVRGLLNGARELLHLRRGDFLLADIANEHQACRAAQPGRARGGKLDRQRRAALGDQRCLVAAG